MNGQKWLISSERYTYEEASKIIKEMLLLGVRVNFTDLACANISETETTITGTISVLESTLPIKFKNIFLN